MCREYATTGEVWAIQNTGECVEKRQHQENYGYKWVELWVIQNTGESVENTQLQGNYG